MHLCSDGALRAHHGNMSLFQTGNSVTSFGGDNFFRLLLRCPFASRCTSYFLAVFCIPVRGLSALLHCLVAAAVSFISFPLPDVQT